MRGEENEREGRREELTGLRQTQRMAAAVDPCCPPALQQEHTYASLLQKKKESIVYFEELFPKCRDVNSTFGVSDQADRGCSVR